MRGVWLFRLFTLWVLLLATLWVAQPYVRAWLFARTEPKAIVARGDLAEYEHDTVEVFSARGPAVALVVTRRTGRDPFGRGVPGTGAGSGFVWDEAGHIVTNNHVVAGAQAIGVRLDAERTVPAELVGSAPDYDLAVLRPLEPLEPVAPIPVGSSEDLVVGQTVYAIGNPFGLSRSMSLGIISALDRLLPAASGREIRGVIQTDAAINPGNSGGPLLDTAGRLIGVNTAIFSETGNFAGIGFAVPVDVVNEVVPQLIEHGRAPRPGIGIAALDPAAAAGIDLPTGVVVAEVMPGSAAEEAGLQGIDPNSGTIGDIITHVDGERVRTVADLAQALATAGIGNSAELTVVRDGETRTVTVDVVDIG